MPDITNTRYRVFVSSTVLDLKSERDAVVQAVLKVGGLPAGVDTLPANPGERWADALNADLERSDYFVLILGDRTGHTSRQGKSPVELEYQLAVEAGIPTLIFAKGVPEGLNLPHSGRVERLRTANAFAERLLRDRLVKFFSSPEQLALEVIKALTGAFHNSPQRGWRRTSSSTDEGAIQGGLVEFRESFAGISYEEVIRASSELLIVLNDGRSWVSANIEALRNRCSDPSKKTRFLLIHPEVGASTHPHSEER